MDSAERKVLMLKRVTKRLQYRLTQKDNTIKAMEDKTATLYSRIKALTERLKGNGTSVPVPEGMAASYNHAIDFAAKFNYNDGQVIDIWKDPRFFDKSAGELTGQPVISWKIVKIADGLYDAEFLREWQYL